MEVQQKTTHSKQDVLNIIEPIMAGIIVALFNRYVLNGSYWCNSESVSACSEDCDSSSSQTTTAVNTDAAMTHHTATHVY